MTTYAIAEDTILDMLELNVSERASYASQTPQRHAWLNDAAGGAEIAIDVDTVKILRYDLDSENGSPHCLFLYDDGIYGRLSVSLQYRHHITTSQHIHINCLPRMSVKCQGMIRQPVHLDLDRPLSTSYDSQ